MKLVATVSSERASKGQAGNEYIEIALVVENDSKERIPFDRLILKRQNDWYTLTSLALQKEISRQYAIDHNPRTCENSSPCYDCAMTERGTHQNAKEP